MAVRTHLNEKQIKTIELMLIGELNIKAICAEVGISRTTFYAWQESELFKAELDKRKQEITDQCREEFKKKLPEAMNKYWELCNSADNRTKESALRYWIDRALGKVTTPVQVDDNRTAPEDEIDLKEMFAQVKKDMNSSKSTVIPLNFRPDKQAQ